MKIYGFCLEGKTIFQPRIFFFTIFIDVSHTNLLLVEKLPLFTVNISTISILTMKKAVLRGKLNVQVTVLGRKKFHTCFIFLIEG